MFGRLEAEAFGFTSRLYEVQWDDALDKWIRTPTSVVRTRYAAVNGMLNDLQYATDLMGAHIRHKYGAHVNKFTLFHNPTFGPAADFWESFLDKMRFTTDITKEFARVLTAAQASGRQIDWVAHSQGGVIFTEAVRYSGGKFSNMGVAFHAGANNRKVTAKILADAQVRHYGHLDHPNDPVPKLAGMNADSPFMFLGALFHIPNVIWAEPHNSVHTYPYKGGTYEY